MRVLDKIKRDRDKAKQEMDKEALPGEIPPSKWVCNYIECAFGMGLAGRHSCPGTPDQVDCPEFITTEDFLAQWREEEEDKREC